MKKFLKTTSTVILSIFVLEVLLSLVAYTPEHEYKLNLTQSTWVYNHEALFKDLVSKSDIPFKTGVQLISEADSIQKILATQYKNFNDTTKIKK